MRAAVGGVLAVDEREKRFFEPLRVAEDKFERLRLIVQRRIQRLVAHLVAQQVEEAVARKEQPAVVFDAQSGVQERIELQAAFDVFCGKRCRCRKSPDPARS